MVTVVGKPMSALVREHKGTDIAAWTLRRRGRVVNWRDEGLESNQLIAPWAVLALANGDPYADLLYSELAAMMLTRN